MSNIKRIGFACKFSELDSKGQVASVPELNTKTTTVAWLNRQSKAVAEQRLWDIMVHNIESARRLIERIGEENDHRRMVRLSSDLLPVYTESSWCYFWQLSDVRQYAEKHFADVGRLARNRDVRLSFHPGGFTVLASDSPDIVNKSIEEFEYHVNMARWMGYGTQFQDLKLNVHVSGRRGAQGMREMWGRLSPEARNMITLENDEISHGLDVCLELADLAPTVLDIHHHFVKTGEYIQSTDPRITQIVDSWRGVRPVVHFSVTREDVLPDHCPNTLPCHATLTGRGINKQKLRAHSNYMWNNAVNNWAYTHWQWADLMIESKAKNLASFPLADMYKNLDSKNSA